MELFGDGIDAFFPVLRTDDIGNLGTICCSDGEYPEAVRALAFNGAEVVYRPSEAVPMTQAAGPGGGTWLLQNRAHAHFNNVYMICPNVGPVYVHPKMEHPFDIAGGNSHIVDYQGNVLGHTASEPTRSSPAIIDIEALRQFRVMNLNSNWMKDLRTELFRRMYDEPIHPEEPVAGRVSRHSTPRSTRSTGRTSSGCSPGAATPGRPTGSPGRATYRPAATRPTPSGRRCPSSGSDTALPAAAGRAR